MPYFLLSLLIFITPFIINPFSGYFFEPPKVIFAEILIELILVFTLFKNTSFLKSFNIYQLILSGVIFILTLLNLILIKNPQIFFGNEFRLQGIFLLWNLIVLSFLSSKMNMSKLPKILFPVSLIFFLVTSFLIEPDINGRTISTLGEANALASSVVFFWPLAFFINFERKLKDIGIKIGVLLLTAVIILFSGSYSGILAFILQVIFLSFVKWIDLKKAVILVFLLVFLSLVLPFIKGGGWYENRSEIWESAFVAGGQNPLGWGFGNIEQGIYQTSLNLNNNVRFQAVDSSHNFLLDFWVQGGVIGLGSIISLIFLSLKGLIKQFKVVEITVFLGLICVLLFNPASIATLVAFWFVLGQGFRRYN